MEFWDIWSSRIWKKTEICAGFFRLQKRRNSSSSWNPTGSVGQKGPMSSSTVQTAWWNETQRQQSFHTQAAEYFKYLLFKNCKQAVLFMCYYIITCRFYSWSIAVYLAIYCIFKSFRYGHQRLGSLNKRKLTAVWLQYCDVPPGGAGSHCVARGGRQTQKPLTAATCCTNVALQLIHVKTHDLNSWLLWNPEHFYVGEEMRRSFLVESRWFWAAVVRTSDSCITLSKIVFLRT